MVYKEELKKMGLFSITCRNIHGYAYSFSEVCAKDQVTMGRWSGHRISPITDNSKQDRARSGRLT